MVSIKRTPDIQPRKAVMPTRREFLIRAAAAGLPSIISSGIAGPASAAVTTNAHENNWDQGRVQHLLPTVNHDRLLIKASFDQSLLTAPELHVGANRVRGQRNTASGDFWQFDASGLKPATTYQLSLIGARGRALCEPWSLSTFPAPDAMPSPLAPHDLHMRRRARRTQCWPAGWEDQLPAVGTAKAPVATRPLFQAGCPHREWGSDLLGPARTTGPERQRGLTERHRLRWDIRPCATGIRHCE